MLLLVYLKLNIENANSADVLKASTVIPVFVHFSLLLQQLYFWDAVYLCCKTFKTKDKATVFLTRVFLEDSIVKTTQKINCPPLYVDSLGYL